MENNIRKLEKTFFQNPVDVVAENLVGKIIVREKDGKEIARMRIITTEAYGGGENSSTPDCASHSHECNKGANNGKGQELEGGNLYIAYSRSREDGNQRQINITTGEAGDAQAVLIKECQLLYRDNIPNKEGDKNGLLSETKIAAKFEMNDNAVGGYSMDEFGITIFSDGDLIEISERKNAKNDKPWRFSINRLFSVIIVCIIAALLLCETSSTFVYALPVHRELAESATDNLGNIYTVGSHSAGTVTSASSKMFNISLDEYDNYHITYKGKKPNSKIPAKLYVKWHAYYLDDGKFFDHEYFNTTQKLSEVELIIKSPKLKSCTPAKSPNVTSVNINKKSKKLKKFNAKKLKNLRYIENHSKKTKLLGLKKLKKLSSIKTNTKVSINSVPRKMVNLWVYANKEHGYSVKRTNADWHRAAKLFGVRGMRYSYPGMS